VKGFTTHFGNMPEISENFLAIHPNFIYDEVSV
jgi:hypothetical protein